MIIRPNVPQLIFVLQQRNLEAVSRHHAWLRPALAQRSASTIRKALGHEESRALIAPDPR